MDFRSSRTGGTKMSAKRPLTSLLSAILLMTERSCENAVPMAITSDGVDVTRPGYRRARNKRAGSNESPEEGMVMRPDGLSLKEQGHQRGPSPCGSMAIGCHLYRRFAAPRSAFLRTTGSQSNKSVLCCPCQTA